MNINPISFGRTVKVNAPYKVAQQAANLVNDFNVETEEKKAQKQLQTLFYDKTRDGDAQVFSINDKTSYILSGEESKKAYELRSDMEDAIESAGAYYGAGDLFEIAMESHTDRYVDLMKLLISETHDGTEIDIDYDKNKKQIKSINVMI